MMSKVYCCETWCIHNSTYGCKLPTVMLRTGSAYNILGEVEQVWICDSCEMSEESKEVLDALRRLSNAASGKELHSVLSDSD